MGQEMRSCREFFEWPEREVVFGECDAERCAKIVEQLRWLTSRSGQERIGLKEYVDRMKSDQREIYYLVCPVWDESVVEISLLPMPEELRCEDVELVYVIDMVDAWAITQLKKAERSPFGGVRFRRVDVEQSRPASVPSEP